MAARYSARWSRRVRARALARAVWLASSAFTRSYLHRDAWTTQGAFPPARSVVVLVIGTLCPPPTASPLKPHFASQLIGAHALAIASSPGGGGPPQFSYRPSHHSAPLTSGGSWTLHLQGLRVVRGLRPLQQGSAPPCYPLGARFIDAAGLAFMLRTGESLALHRGLCHGASLVGSRLAAAVSYRAAWPLPGLDFHRLVDVSLREITCFPDPPPFSGVPLPGHA